MESPYEVLGVDPDADDAAIERAYRRRVKETHPDQGGSPREFQLVRAAYEALATGDRSDRRAHGTGETNADAPGPAAGGRSGDGPARHSSGSPGGRPHDRAEADPGRDPSRVEYLDYEVLADRGWALDDAGLFEKAAASGLDPSDRGRILVRGNESLLQAAENRGFAWPYSCRGGACANCAVAVLEGELSMPVNHVLPPEMLDRGIRLSCVGRPTTDELQVVYNVKHLPDLDELRLPPRPFEAAPDE